MSFLKFLGKSLLIILLTIVGGIFFFWGLIAGVMGHWWGWLLFILSLIAFIGMGYIIRESQVNFFKRIKN